MLLELSCYLLGILVADAPTLYYCKWIAGMSNLWDLMLSIVLFAGASYVSQRQDVIDYLSILNLNAVDTFLHYTTVVECMFCLIDDRQCLAY